MISKTQIFFDEKLKKKKEKSGLTWCEAVELGIDFALKKKNFKKKEVKNGKHK